MEIEDLTRMNIAELAEYTKMHRGVDGMLEFRFDAGEEDEMYVVIACGDAAVLVAEVLDDAFGEDPEDGGGYG